MRSAAGSDVVVATVDARERRVVRLLDPVSGEVRWKATSTGSLASVTVAGDRVLLAGADSTTVATGGLSAAGGSVLEALSLDDGSSVWTRGGRAASDRRRGHPRASPHRAAR